MPVLDDSQHEAIAQLMAGGMDAKDAYTAVYTKASKRSAKGNCWRIASNEVVRARVKEIQAQSATALVLTMQERREFMARVVRVDMTKLDTEKDGALVQEIIEVVTEDKDGGRKVRTTLKLPGKRECVMDDAKLAGELIDKVEAKDTTPREPLEVVRARIEAAKAQHGRS